VERPSSQSSRVAMPESTDMEDLHWHKNASPWEEKLIVYSSLSRTSHTVPPNRKMAKKKGECKFWEVSINYFHNI